LRVTAARITGIESDHRTLARVIGPDVVAQDGGPIGTITGLQGVAESLAPPNNNGYERTQCWIEIDQAVAALTPFVDITAAKAAGFDVSRSFGFHPFTPKLPNPLGGFISFAGNVDYAEHSECMTRSRLVVPKIINRVSSEIKQIRSSLYLSRI
jgi:hypothetical protein